MPVDAGRPRVAVGSLGGTITMTSATGGAVTPSLDADALTRSVPGLADAAEVVAATLRTVPGAWLGPTDVAEVARWAAGQVTGRDPVDGVVVVQGTDTIEETAYLLDLYWDHVEPLVVTGAMRPPAAAGADGPANLLAAAVVAGAAVSRHRGVLVVLDDAVHAAARVRKTDSMATGAFTSGAFGVAGRVHEGSVTYAARAGRHAALPLASEGSDPRVALLETHLGDRGELLRLVLDAGCDGIVLAGFGAGHASAELAEAVGAAARRCPVVLASRTGGGPVLSRTYGFVGSERDMIARGAVPAGWLDGRKARLLLWALLAAGADAAAVRAEVTARGGAPGGPA